jgi:hypothetical protein
MELPHELGLVLLPERELVDPLDAFGIVRSLGPDRYVANHASESTR